MSDNRGHHVDHLHVVHEFANLPEVHLHFHGQGGSSGNLTKQDLQDALEALMSDLSARFDALDSAVGDMKAVVAEDVQHLMDLLAQALQTAADDQTTIDALQADADAAKARIDNVIASVGAVNPDPDFPVVEPPAEPPA